MSVEVYGASDDLIEVEGDIREEFTLPDDELAYLAFSNGALISVEYGNDGLWNIRVRSGDVGVARATDEARVYDFDPLPEVDRGDLVRLDDDEWDRG